MKISTLFNLTNSTLSFVSSSHSPSELPRSTITQKSTNSTTFHTIHTMMHSSKIIPPNITYTVPSMTLAKPNSTFTVLNITFIIPNITFTARTHSKNNTFTSFKPGWSYRASLLQPTSSFDYDEDVDREYANEDELEYIYLDDPVQGDNLEYANEGDLEEVDLDDPEEKDEDMKESIKNLPISTGLPAVAQAQAINLI